MVGGEITGAARTAWQDRPVDTDTPPAAAPPRQGFGGIRIRRARTSDVRAVARLVAGYAQERILLGKETVTYYEDIQEFQVAVAEGGVVGCGALHVLWEDLAEVRTLAVDPGWVGHGVGHLLLEALLRQAKDVGVSRVFCLTFEVEFFRRHGFRQIEGTPVEAEVYAELLHSADEGVAEFLDLARVKPNTLGNARMLREL
jgi:amino-acid N-acetyltransferase